MYDLLINVSDAAEYYLPPYHPEDCRDICLIGYRVNETLQEACRADTLWRIKYSFIYYKSCQSE